MEADPCAGVCATDPSEATAEAVPTSAARFRAMGTDAHVVVTGNDADRLLESARRRIDEFEQRWSRFLPGSDICRATRGAGTAVSVDRSTLELLERAVVGWRATGGRWNPLMGVTLARLGYDRPFAAGLADDGSHVPQPAVGLDRVAIDRTAGTICLPPGTGLDVGGIAKGHTADLVTRELLDDGAWGAMVNLGGDLSVRGLPPAGLDWTIRIREPLVHHDAIAIVGLPTGGVATSTTARRRWPGRFATTDRHHLLDPRTGEPAEAGRALTTVIAGEAWWAEVAATALTVDPTLELPNVAVLSVDTDGRIVQDDAFAAHHHA